MLQRIDMVAIYVHDWPAALTWYEEKLGFSPTYVERDDRFAVLALPGGGPVVHLVGDDMRDRWTRNRCAPNIGVDDFDATLAEVRRRGVTVLEVEDEPDDGYRLARLADPEGNELNVYTFVPPRPGS